MLSENSPIYLAAFPRKLREVRDLGRYRFGHTTQEVASIIRNGTPHLDAPHKATLLALLRGVKDADLAVFDTRSTLSAKQISCRIGASLRTVQWHIQNLASHSARGPFLLDLTADSGGREVYDLWPTFMLLPEMRSAANTTGLPDEAGCVQGVS